jgi:flagellar biosynthesis/type III secretory pathway protein FliH
LLELGEDVGIKKGRRQGLREGRRKGIEKGTLLGQRRLLEDLLRARFGELPAAATQRLDVADANELQAFGLRVLSATTLDDVFPSP